ncbi:MAG: hypothetical protein ABSD28_00870 [Tepidisphaeraceae bacterium]|jgi:hypothetical protein
MNTHVIYWYTTDVLKALTPLVIGLLAAYIAYQQWRTNHRKLKLDLFDRRYKVYQAARQLLNVTETGGATDDVTVRTMVREFQHDVQQGAFIFPPSVLAVLQQILNTTLKSRSLDRQLTRATVAQNEERAEKISDEWDKVCGSLENMDRALTEVFTPLLDLTTA